MKYQIKKRVLDRYRHDYSDYIRRANEQQLMNIWKNLPLLRFLVKEIHPQFELKNLRAADGIGT